MTNKVADRVALVIDDHPITHIGCRSLLAELGFATVERADDIPSALRLADRRAPDLIVLDLGLPGVGGLKAMPQLQARVPDARILVFTMNESAALAALALENGAAGFLSKNTPPEAFIAAVDTVMAGQVYLERELAIDVATRAMRRDSTPFANLTPREHQVLRLIGEGKTYEDIAGEIHVSYKTVANTSSALKRKLSAKSLPELMRLAVTAYTPDGSPKPGIAVPHGGDTTTGT